MLSRTLYNERLEADHWWFTGRRRIIKAALHKYVPSSDGLVLDIGSGCCANSDILKAYGKVVTLDIHRLSNSIQADAQQLPFQKSSFKLITAFDVLEHVPYQFNLVAEVHHALIPEGFFVLTVPATPSMWSSHDEELGHYRRYTGKEIYALLDLYRFNVVKLTHFNSLLFPLGYLRKFGWNSRHRLDMLPLPKSLNFVLELPLSIEAFMTRWFSLPFGASLLAVAQKKQ